MWQWHFDFIELSEKCKPNAGHHALLKFQEFCVQNAAKAKCHMITQNIDDYDAQLIRKSKILVPEKIKDDEGSETYAFTPYLIEMHGNVKYMHCSNETEDCSNKFYLAPTLEEVNDRTNHVPKCPECQFPMKPHAMFFDESYNEHYYRHETTKMIENNETDCLIVIGTALATSGARTFVFNTLRKNDIPVIEFNLDPQCDVGYSLQVTEKCETALNNFFNEFYKLSGATPAPIASAPTGTLKP